MPEPAAAVEILALSAWAEARGQVEALCAAEWGAATGYGRADWGEEIARSLAHPLEEVFIARTGGQVAGAVWFIEHETPPELAHLSPWVSALVVAPELRRRGIGAALLARAAEYATLGGYQRLHALTTIPGFFARLGWELGDPVRTPRGLAFLAWRTPPATDR